MIDENLSPMTFTEEQVAQEIKEEYEYLEAKNTLHQDMTIQDLLEKAYTNLINRKHGN